MKKKTHQLMSELFFAHSAHFGPLKGVKCLLPSFTDDMRDDSFQAVVRLFFNILEGSMLWCS